MTYRTVVPDDSSPVACAAVLLPVGCVAPLPLVGLAAAGLRAGHVECFAC
jgi:hypothetical protein